MGKKWWMFLAGMWLLTACNPMTTDIEGKWQLKQIESEAGTVPVDTVWYNFETTLFDYQLYRPSTSTYSYCYGFSTYEGKHLHLKLLSNPAPVAQFLPLTDWEAAERDFEVVERTSKRLVLSSEGKLYHFKKF